MAEVAVTILLEEVEEVFKWHKNLISGSESEFGVLKYDLHMLKAFLRDTRNKLEEGEVFRKMEGQIREMVYDVEDTIETFLAAETAAKSRILLGRRRLSLAKEIKFLREDKVRPIIDAVQARFTAHRAGTSSEGPPFRPQKYQIIRQDKVVGFEDEEAELMRYLTEQKEELDVISIIGMHGLGKTTLAWKVFQSEEICYQFPIRIWVYVSQKFNSRDAFLKILRQFTSNDMSGLSDEELAQSVRACLAREKFLIVMDDVWSPQDWIVIQYVLPQRNGLSKVMITSCEMSVGECANVSRGPLMKRFFRLDESWKLLQLEVFGNEEDCPQELRDVGQDIASQCYGVPLTVVVVGGILVDLFAKTGAPHLLIKEWDNVSKNVSNFIQNNSKMRIQDVVELSYNRLPDYLKECFLYTAVFPEEHVIPARMLTYLWIAEGFIWPQEGRSLEEVAEENLGELISRNLLMLDHMNPMGEIKTCRVHDMIRVFCKERALEQNLFQEIRKSKQGVFEPPVSEVPRFHRLCFNSDLTRFFSEQPRGPRTRSFLCFYKEHINLDPRYISTIPDAFHLLRVLESISIKFHQFPAKVTKLIHLRYITLNIDALKILPESLSQLRNLKTLVVETKSRSVTMKANIWKMYGLRHLKMKAAIILNSKWDGEGGENLQTLSRLAPECCAEVSKRACNLKELGIRGKLDTLFSTMSLEKFDRLEKLNLMNDVHYEDNPLPVLPQGNFFPPNLKRLTLSCTFLEWSQISTLAMIHTLEVLKLKDYAFSGIYWSAMDDCFPGLQFLLIVNANLVHWEVSTDSFPTLRCLVLKNCEQLNVIPAELVKTLQVLDIDRLRKSAVDSARRIELEKIQALKTGEVKSRVPFKLSIGPGCGY
ncbi:hypothetical protein C2S51_010425 [Perilla frutescens var. frutescens]|nr:hypothetical protein C2S51_010425 [Perilla frutescens var. frutescens]